MRLAGSPPTPPSGPADPTPVATISHPARRIPPLDVALDEFVDGASWSNLDDAIAGAAELTRAPNAPMLALVRDAATGVIRARGAYVDITPHPDRARWTRWLLESAIGQAGPAVVDWSDAHPQLVAFVDGRAVVRRP